MTEQQPPNNIPSFDFSGLGLDGVESNSQMPKINFNNPIVKVIVVVSILLAGFIGWRITQSVFFKSKKMQPTHEQIETTNNQQPDLQLNSKNSDGNVSLTLTPQNISVLLNQPEMQEVRTAIHYSVVLNQFKQRIKDDCYSKNKDWEKFDCINYYAVEYFNNMENLLTTELNNNGLRLSEDGRTIIFNQVFTNKEDIIRNFQPRTEIDKLPSTQFLNQD